MENRDEMEIDLVELFYYLKKKVWILVGAVVACAVIGFVVSKFFMAPVYTASTRLYVLNRSNENTMVYSDFQVSSQMLNDYKVLITGQNVTHKVIEKLGLNLSAGELAGKIKVTAPNETRVLQISVSDHSAQRAAEIANCVREIASEQIKDIMDVDAVKLVYEAEVPRKPSAPSVKKNTMIGAVLGLLLSGAGLVMVYIMDGTIRTEDDVEHYLGLSVLAVIPDSRQLESRAGAAARTKQQRVNGK